MLNNLKGEKRFNAGFQDLQLTDKKHAREIKVALWYPALKSEKPIRYLDDYPGIVAENAPLLHGSFPFIISSHGSGGHRFNQHYIGEELARYGYYYAAIQHPYNNHLNDDDENDIANFWYRPQDIRFVIDYFQSEIASASITEKGVVVLGHSYGGYTALTLAGGKPSKRKFDALFTNRRNIFFDFSDLSDFRIVGLILLAPALSCVFNRNSLKDVTQPTLLVVSEKDEIIKGDDKYYLEILPSKPNYLEFKKAGHYVYLMSCPDSIKERLPLIACDRGLARENVHPKLLNEVIEFLKSVF